jgi:hypothetical protein
MRHYSYRTEKTYIEWIVQYIRFHNIKHPKDMGAADVEAFLTHLAASAQCLGFDAESSAFGFAVSLSGSFAGGFALA